MTKDITNLVASIHDRLRNRAKELNKPFMEVLQYYGIERFLYRLSKSEHSRKFILKGGLVFYSWGLPLRRATQDIDLRGYTSNSTENLNNIIRDICLCPVSEDALAFHLDTIKIVTIIPNAEYQGIRVNLQATLGRSQIPIQVDIGFTDEIVPAAQDTEYPSLLQGMEKPQIRSYSRESIISEKFHAMVFLDEINNRFKDYYDIWMLSEQYDFEGTILTRAIETTFRLRETAIPNHIPVALSDSFQKEHQGDWERFLLKNKLTSPQIINFGIVLERLRCFLMPSTQALFKTVQFEKHWKAGQDWI